MAKCYFCNKKAIKFMKHIPVDADLGDHNEDGNLTLSAIYGDVWLCSQHLWE